MQYTVALCVGRMYVFSAVLNSCEILKIQGVRFLIVKFKSNSTTMTEICVVVLWKNWANFIKSIMGVIFNDNSRKK